METKKYRLISFGFNLAASVGIIGTVAGLLGFCGFLPLPPHGSLVAGLIVGGVHLASIGAIGVAAIYGNRKRERGAKLYAKEQGLHPAGLERSTCGCLYPAHNSIAKSPFPF
jgi:hypothetical protein